MSSVEKSETEISEKRSDPAVSSKAETSTAVVSSISSIEADDENRGEWDNKIEFTLTTLGVAVGLGNIWRFPTRAYENGGSAFLFPYLCCSILFGLPVLYAEFLVGQYHRRSPVKIFSSIAPVLEGFGWMLPLVSTIISIYYITIIGWAVLYLAGVFMGHTSVWNFCNNDWNDKGTCYDSRSYSYCTVDNSNYTVAENVTKFFYKDGDCLDLRLFSNVSLMTATEQYFQYNVMRPSNGLLDINRINWNVFGSMVVLWGLIIVVLFKGIKYLGKASYVTVPLPYVIIVIFLIRGVTLPGASTGIYYYLGKPDWSKILVGKTWTEALKQLCFSVSLGQATMLSMASYNNPKNNCFRDALIVVIGDTMMSVVGGIAVFSTLGFLAESRGVPITDVVDSGLSLAFTVYPEAMSHMPLPWLWSFLFFFMLFLLGFSSEAGFVEVMCTNIYDQFPSTRAKKWAVVTSVSVILFVVGIPMCTDAGFYWFEMFDEYTAGFSSVAGVICELVIFSYIYGWKNLRSDMVEMLGVSKNTVIRWIGKNSPYFRTNWALISPVCGLILLILCVWREYPYKNDSKKYPPLFDILGWFLACLPIFPVVFFAVLGYFRWKAKGLDIRGYFMKQKSLRSYARIYSRMTEQNKQLQSILPEVTFVGSKSKEVEVEESNSNPDEDSQ